MSTVPEKRRGIFARAARAPLGWFGFSRSMEPARRATATLKSVGDSVRSTLNPAPGRVESFDEAVKRMGLSESAIQESLLGHQTKVKLVGLLLVIDLALLVYFAFTTDWMSLLAGGTLAAAFVSSLVTGLFRCWQIRNRSLVGFADWFAAKDPLDGMKGPLRPAKPS